MLHKIFAFQSSRLIFDLFLEHKINSFYESSILNTLSKEKFSANNSIFSTLKQVYIVKDVPDYLKLSLLKKHPNLRFKKVKQYHGYLLNIENKQDAIHYINKNLNSRNRKNLYAKKRKLYNNHNITTSVYYGAISAGDYNNIFDAFYVLLKNRFDEKKIHNRYLSNWKALQASTYQKILDKKASLHVVFDGAKPIAITLNFHINDIVFSHIQTYHVNYSKYNMGDICMHNHLEWLIKNKFRFFDLSMGKTYNKEKWSNHKYTLMYHVFYNNASVISKLCAKITVKELQLMQYLRDKNIVGKLINMDRFLYLLKGRRLK
ncbi:GNAT family N-acetyltransferase [Gelatiniphilus marinus]|uniref:GNAT family N-acetyltransferase n=1 Tax=Gelatiniphilus marinus TaxID=1759464 RepID=A0ABW5JNG2_9FLAO